MNNLLLVLLYVSMFSCQLLQLKDKISEDDRKKIESKCDEVIKWLDGNQTAEKDEFEHHQKELESVCNPIITKLYQSAGGMPGGMHKKYIGDFSMGFITFEVFHKETPFFVVSWTLKVYEEVW